MDRNREPCPDRIIDDAGGAFTMGAVGGSVWHYFGGVRHAPRGERFIGGWTSMQMKAPRTAGGFAVWGTLFSLFDCTTVFIRQKEDPWNSIIAGGLTGGTLAFRQGARAALKSGIQGAVLLALMEGLMITANKMSQKAQQELQLSHMDEIMSQLPSSTTESSTPSWFGRLFGGGKKEEEKSSGGRHTEVLESFDAPSPPTFEFK